MTISCTAVNTRHNSALVGAARSLYGLGKTAHVEKSNSTSVSARRFLTFCTHFFCWLFVYRRDFVRKNQGNICTHQLRLLQDTTMPRSFLVKKYFTSKKPNYSELESQSGPLSAGVPERYPLAELPTGENGLSTACCPAGLVWDVSILPGLYTPEPVSIPSPTGPLDLSSSHSSSSEEDEGRSSDPPSPEPAERHQCPNCGKSYGGPAALSRHRLSCCGKDAAAAPATRPAFHCKHCTKEYSSLGALKMHIRSHTLPCVCGTCGKAFSRPWLLRGHIRTHTGERPFSCPHCSRAFADRSNLRAHLQTHSEVKKYQCAGCSRTFSRMSLLHKHTVAGCCSSPSS